MIYSKLLAYTSLAAPLCLAGPIQNTPDASLLPRHQHGSIDDRALDSRDQHGSLDDRRRGQHGSLDDAPIIVTRSNINGNTPIVMARDDGHGNPSRADRPLSARGD